MKSRSALLAIPALLVASSGWAAPIYTYSLLAHTVSLGSNVTVNAGLVGSNVGKMVVNGGSITQGIEGGGQGSVGNNANILGNMIFNGNVVIGGGTNIGANGNPFNVDATGTISLGSNADIWGNATASSTITVGGGAVIHGTTTQNGSPATFTPVVLPTASVFVGGGADQTTGGGGLLTLAPGTYGDLTMGSNSVLNLSSGVYVFDSVNLDGGTDINYTITAGVAITIYVVGNVSLGSNMTTTINGANFASATAANIKKIYWEAHGTWTQNGGTPWLGSIYTPTANLSFGSNTDLKGQYLSGAELTLNGGSTVHALNTPEYLDPLPPGEVDVPEPSTMLLSALGALGLLLRRRLRK